MVVEVSRERGRQPKVAVNSGTRFATSTQLSVRILRLIHKGDWSALPAHTRDWLRLQQEMSRLPRPGRLLIESFPHAGRENAAIYGFAGRNAQATLGLILSKRMVELGLAPLGFVATDHATLIWGLEALSDPHPLFAAESLRQGLERWLSGNQLIKRTFRVSATIAGLIQRNIPQARKSGRQASFSSDILYDTLAKYDPDHLLLRITGSEAMRGLIDFGRIEEMLARIGSRIDLVRLPRVTPLAAPLFLEMGRTSVEGTAEERLLAEEAARLMAEAGLSDTRAEARRA